LRFLAISVGATYQPRTNRYTPKRGKVASSPRRPWRQQFHPFSLGETYTVMMVVTVVTVVTVVMVVMVIILWVVART